MNIRATVTPSVVFAALALAAVPAHAELVYFNTGRTMSVKAHRVDGSSLVLELRSGGEMVCESSLIARFAPDEVPYPEPVVEAPPAPVQEAQATTGPYSEIIERVSAEQEVSAKLVRAVIQVESAYNPRARSPKGAMGLMQLMPATARQYAVADPYDAASNIEGGIKHLKSLMQRLPVALALAAYNAGEAAVQRFNGIPPYPETRNYVSRILALANR
jgi:soluble lytic murein transglycosylase-like protein